MEIHKKLDKINTDIQKSLEKLEEETTEKIKDILKNLVSKYGDIKYRDVMGKSWFAVSKIKDFSPNECCRIYSNMVVIDDKTLWDEGTKTEKEEEIWRDSEDLREILQWVNDNFDYLRVGFYEFCIGPPEKTPENA